MHRKKTTKWKICIEIPYYYIKICIVILHKSKKTMENFVEEEGKISYIGLTGNGNTVSPE